VLTHSRDVEERYNRFVPVERALFRSIRTMGTSRVASTMKRSIQSLLRTLGLHERLQSSVIYDLYWRIANPRLIAQRRAEEAFYRKLLSGLHAGQTIFDVGANLGYKTDIFLRLGARVVAVDPDKSNQEILKRKFHRYRMSRKPVQIVGAALSDRNGVETMWVDAPGSSFNTLSQKWVDSLRSDADRYRQTFEYGQELEVRTTTLEDLVTTYGMPYYVKIDVEGYEPAVLRGLKRSVPFLSFEVNLPDFKAEGFECIELLNKLDEGGLFNYAITCERGLVSEQWLPAAEFLTRFDSCNEPSIEVYWKT
jgi:FkbM family methyltransferase